MDELIERAVEGRLRAVQAVASNGFEWSPEREDGCSVDRKYWVHNTGRWYLCCTLFIMWKLSGIRNWIKTRALSACCGCGMRGPRLFGSV